MTILLAIAGLLAGAAITWLASDRLESSSLKLARHYRLPEIVTGAVITAVGSSFPELSSVVIATLVHGEFELGVAAIVGSAIFNILVIPAASVLCSDRSLKATRAVVFKETQFYLISVAVLLLSFSFAVIYHPIEGEQIQGEFTRGLALIPVSLYGIYLFIQWLDTTDHQAATETSKVDLLSHPIKQWAILLLSMIVIAIGVELLIRGAISLGKELGTPTFLWGLTVVAAGTSLPDMLISIKAARAGRSESSLANVLGSNIFDLLIAVPVGVLLAGSIPINFSHAAPMMGCLTLATVVFFVMLRRHFELDRQESIILLLVYIVFVAWMAMETFGFSSVLTA